MTKTNQGMTMKASKDALDTLYTTRVAQDEALLDDALRIQQEQKDAEHRAVQVYEQETAEQERVAFLEKLDAISGLDTAVLKKMKKNLQTLNSKDQSMLDFQSPNHTGQKMPLPNGPKRSKLETRIRDRIKLIEEIEIRIIHLSC